MLVLLVLVEAAFFAFYGSVRHANYLTSILDLGQVDQAIWGFLAGKPFLNTVLFSTDGSWLGGHFSPILAVFAPLYWLKPSVHWLTCAQAVALPVAALPLFALARNVLESERLAFCWGVAYLCNPLVLNAAAWDFHAVTLAVPLIALAAYALHAKRFRLLLVALGLVLLCMEHFGVLVAGFGLLWLIRYREWRPGLSLVLLGAITFVGVVGVLMPHFAPSESHLMISAGEGQLSRYGWLGRSPMEILSTLIGQPLETAKAVLVEMRGWIYLFWLMLPFLFLPVFAPLWLLAGSADLAVNLLSANPLPRSVFSYHSVALIPVVMLSALCGVRRCTALLGRGFAQVASGLVLIAAVSLGYLFSSYYPLPGTFFSWAPAHRSPINDPGLGPVKALVGDRSLSVQANLGAHFTQRLEVYRFPNRLDDAEMVVLRLASPTLRPIGSHPKEVGTLSHHLQMSPGDYLRTVEQLLQDESHAVVYWSSPWLVLQRGGTAVTDHDEVRVRIGELKRAWQ